MITVHGRTWELRDRLRSLGGRWNAEQRHWEFHDLSDQVRNELTRNVGVTIRATDHGEPWRPPILHQPKQFKAIDNTDPIERLIARMLAGESDIAKRDGKTNVFGDDQTWFNYFADKNPISFFGFSSLSAMIKFVEAIDNSQFIGNRNAGWRTRDPEWSGTRDMDAAIKLARDGWPLGVDMATEISYALTGQHAKEKRRKHSVAGGSVNVGRMLAGNPLHMVSRPKQPGDKIITFFVEASMSASIQAEHAIMRAATVAAIVDILEMNGYSCEIVSIATESHHNRPGCQLATTLKAAGETLNLNDIVFALGHPSYLRRLKFACNAVDTDLSDFWDSMGTPSRAMTETNPNEFFIKKIHHHHRNIIDDDLPLVDQAKLIWNLIVDKELPIRINSDELAEVNRTGRVFQSVWSGSTLFPQFIGSETTVHAIVADFGAVWKLSEQRECHLYQHKYIGPMGGYVVYRAALDNTEHEPAYSLNDWISAHKQAVFVSEDMAQEFCNHMNALTLRNGSDAV